MTGLEVRLERCLVIVDFIQEKPRRRRNGLQDVEAKAAGLCRHRRPGIFQNCRAELLQVLRQHLEFDPHRVLTHRDSDHRTALLEGSIRITRFMSIESSIFWLMAETSCDCDSAMARVPPKLNVA